MVQSYRIPLDTARAPLSIDGGGDPGEHLATANRAAPAGDLAAEQAIGGVWEVIPLNDNSEPARTWQLSARFTATAGDAAASVVLWCHDRTSLQWYPTAEMNLQAVPDTVVGGILELPGRLGTTHVLLEIKGLGDGDTLGLMLRQGD